MSKREPLIIVVVLQTAAANLGSMLTPVGNPQNLYLYSYYGFGFLEFLRVTFPVWTLSLVLILAACAFLPKEELDAFLGEKPGVEKRRLRLYLGLFVVCFLVVVRVCDWPVMLAVVLAALLVFDRGMLLKADFMLLLTFVAFFVFSGNLARVEAVDALLRRLLEGREYLAGVLTSQIISNVPAALLLSGFTDKTYPKYIAPGLGVAKLSYDMIRLADLFSHKARRQGRGQTISGAFDHKVLEAGILESRAAARIGSLGTPIASLASLISMKLYSHSDHAHTGKYLLVFTAVNVVLLVILSVAQSLF